MFNEDHNFHDPAECLVWSCILKRCYCFICLYSAIYITSAWFGKNFELSHYYFGTLLQILSLLESGYSENTMSKTVTYENINLTTLRTKCDITVSCSKIKQEHWGNNFTLKSPHFVLGYPHWRRWYRFISGDAKKRETISAVWNQIPFKIRVRHICSVMFWLFQKILL